MGIIYLLTLIILGSAFLLLKKQEEKLNLVTWIIITIVLMLCYNTFVCYILSMIRIPLYLLILSIINIVIAVVIFSRKRRQEYYIKKTDAIYATLIIAIAIGFAFRQYAMPLNIKYTTTDSALHYIAASRFTDQSRLLNLETPVYENLKTMMPFTYVNTGLLFKSFEGIINRIDFYKIYINFDIFLLALAGLAMYACLSSHSDNSRQQLLAFIISFVYMLGYPLNSMLFGFPYLSMGIIIINMIILIIIKFKLNRMTLFLLTFGLFFSYFLFVPIIYGALFIYFLTKKDIKSILIVLIIPAIFGFCYHILPRAEVVGALQIPGYIYRDYYSNFIFLIPFCTIGLIESKNKKFDISITVLTILFIFMLLVGQYTMNFSDYYFFKNHYFLWLLAFYIAFKAIIFIDKKSEYISIILVFTYAFLAIIHLFAFTGEPTKIYAFYTNNMSVFHINNSLLNKKEIGYTKEELEIIKFVNDNIDFNKKIKVVGDEHKILWFYSMFEYKNLGGLDIPNISEIQNEKEYIADEYQYIIYFKNTEMFEKNYTKVLTDGEIIMENDLGGVLKRSEI